MKRIIFLVLLSMAFATVNAQRVDLDKEHFKHRYRRWPNKVLDSSYSTYSVNVKQTATIEKYFKNDPAAAIAIAGRESVATDGHIQVSVNLGDVIVESSGIRNREEVNKDKDGKETGRRKYYWIELVYRFSADVKVTGYKGEELEAYELESKENKETWRSSEYQSYSEAAKYYDNNKLAIRSDFITKKITSELNDLNASLNANYGFTAIAASEILWKLG